MYNLDIIITTVKYIGFIVFNLIPLLKVVCTSKYAVMLLHVCIFVAKTIIFICHICLGAVVCVILWCCGCICYYIYFKHTPYPVKEYSHAHLIYLFFAFFRKDFLNFLFFVFLFFFVILYATSFFSNAVFMYGLRSFVEENNITWDMRHALYLNGTPNRFDLLESTGLLKSSGFKGPGGFEICSLDITDSAGTSGGNPTPPDPNTLSSLNASYVQQNTIDNSMDMSLVAPVTDATTAHMSNPVSTLSEVINTPYNLNPAITLPHVHNNGINPFHRYFERGVSGPSRAINAFYGHIEHLYNSRALNNPTVLPNSDPSCSLDGCKIMFNSFNNSSHLYIEKDDSGIYISRARRGIFENCRIELFTSSEGRRPRFLRWGLNINDLIRFSHVRLEEHRVFGDSFQRSVIFPNIFRDGENLVGHGRHPIKIQNGLVTIQSLVVKDR